MPDVETEKPRRASNPFADLLAVAFIAFVVISLGKAVVVAGPGDPAKQCIDRQKQIGTAIATYLQDWDERFPAMQTNAVFNKAMVTYLPTPLLPVICPMTRKPYALNAALSNASLASFNTIQDNVEVLRDSVAHPDGKFTVLFLDNHVEQGGKDTADPTLECIARTQSLATALKIYAQDYDEKFPVFTRNTDARTALFPYAYSRIFICPETRKDYTFNPLLSGRGLYSFDHETTVAVRDSIPHRDGKSTVTYLDGHTERGGQPVYLPDVNTVCVSRMRQVLIALASYVQDYDDTYPNADIRHSVQERLYPYTGIYPNTKSHSVFQCPATDRLFVFNPTLYGQSKASIQNPAKTIGFRDPVPHADHIPTIGYVDGHVERDGVTQPRYSANPELEELSRAKQLDLAIFMYVQDYDNTFPPMDNYDRFRSVIYPYLRYTNIGNSDIFVVPVTNAPWVLNQSLSGSSYDAIPAPASTVVFQAPKPRRGGLITRAFADGHVKRVVP